MPVLRARYAALLAILLLFQGVAVASAVPMHLPPAESELVSALVSATSPCHGSSAAAATVDGPTAETADRIGCCDADCPNMSTCLLGAYAPAALPELGLETPTVTALVFRDGSAPHPPLRARLRPPILLQG